MPGWLKVTLVILVVLLVLGGIASFLAFRRLSSSAARLVEEGKEFRREGEAFGQGKSPAACVDESIRRLKSTQGFPAEMKVRLFLDGCLAFSSPEPRFCEAVPAPHEIAQSAEWAINECRQNDTADIPRCSRVMQEVVRYCANTRAK